MEKALHFVGAEVRLARSPEEVGDAAAMVLPGVGAFDDCIQAMQSQKLLEAVQKFVATGRPFLGICVGYQALFEKSEEFNSRATGLGLFQGRVVRFSGNKGLKIPQIGWNTIEITRPECPIFQGVESGSHVYFVHSYHPEPEDDSIAVCRTTYGDTFTSAVWCNNIFATQFHPEKSQRFGLAFLSAFLKWWP